MRQNAQFYDHYCHLFLVLRQDYLCAVIGDLVATLSIWSDFVYCVLGVYFLFTLNCKYELNFRNFSLCMQVLSVILCHNVIDEALSNIRVVQFLSCHNLLLRRNKCFAETRS